MSKKIMTTLCFLGCFLGVFCLYIGICIANSAKQSVCERFNGQPEYIRSVYVSSENNSTYTEESYKKVISSLDKNSSITIGPTEFNYKDKDKELQILSVYPIYFREKPSFIPHLLYGRYLSKDEIENGDRVVVLSKRLFNDLQSGVFTSNSYVEINNVKLKVVGVFDGTVKNSPILNSAFIPLKNSAAIVKGKGIPGFLSFQISNKKADVVKEAEKAKKIFNTIDNNAVLRIYNPSESFSVDISVSCYVISLFSIAIFIITAVNISNLSSMWLLDKQRDFAIMKALGATDGIIVKNIISKIFITYIISALAATAAGYFLVPFIRDMVSVSLISSYNNFIICIITAFAAALLSSIAPIVQAKRMNIANSLKWE